MKKYWTVAAMGWQDSLVYRFNALIWVLYAVLPAITLMLVWRAKYATSATALSPGGLTLTQMTTYYLCVTALSVMITPHPEWEMASQIRDGKITGFIVRPIGYFGYRLSQETSYQVVKSAMMLPALGLMILIFHADLRLPPFDAARGGLFFLASLLAYALLTQMKFLLGLSAFWISEPGGFLELWNVLTSVLGGRLLPITELAKPFPWIASVSGILPFASLYSFPTRIFLGLAAPQEIAQGFAIQIVWLAALSLLVRVAWRRGLLAYEGYGG